MKKLGFALMGLLMISSTGAFAQLSFGVKAGANFSNMMFKAGGEKVDDIKFKPGFNIGAFADFELSDLLAVEAGLNVETKGFKMKEEILDNEIKATTNIFYVTVPVDVKLTFGSFYVLAGPYVGIAAAGKSKTKTEYKGDTHKDSESLDFGDDYGKTKRLDFGLGLGAGYEINDNLGVRAGYDLGLANLQGKGDKDNSSKNGSINVSVTYKF